MKNISTLTKVRGVKANEWFIPTMFDGLELDNTFTLYSDPTGSEYYLDTTNNVLKIKLFNRIRRSFPLNIRIENGKIILFMDMERRYYKSKNVINEFPGLRVNDQIKVGTNTYKVTEVKGNRNIEDLEIEVENKASFINNYTNSAIMIDGQGTFSLYTDDAGVYYSKHYKSNNVADIYIDGKDVRAVVAFPNMYSSEFIPIITYLLRFYKGNTVLSTLEVEEGEVPSLPANPTEPGHTFGGWYTNTALTSSYVPSAVFGDLDLYGKFTINSYTVSFNVNGGTAVASKTVNHGSVLTGIGSTTKNGYTFGGWYTNSGLTTAYTNQPITANTTLYAKWNIQSYAITYNYNTSTTYPVVGTLSPTTYTIVTPKITYSTSSLTRNGYDIAAITPATIEVGSTGAKTVVVTWTAKSYAITLNANGGTGGSINTASYTAADTDGKSVTRTLTAPTRTGYTFNGWTTTAGTISGNTLTIPSGTISAITVTANWTINKYAVTFNTNSGTAVANQTIDHGGYVNPLPTTTRTGFTFGGWFTDAAFTTAFTTTTPVTSVMTVYAKWTQITYTVQFNVDGGTAVANQTIPQGGFVSPLPTTTKTGYTFGGWFTDAAFTTAFTTTTAITANRTVYAKFTINTYTVTFKDHDGTTLKTQTVNHGTAATAPANPSRTGYTFTGWSSTFTNITTNLTVNAQYTINTYTVRFLNWNDAVLSTATVNHGSAATAPANPTRTGYTFTGWLPATFTNITSNTDIKAQFTINTYTVTFVDYDDTVLKTQTVNYGSAATAPVDPVREGFTFTGWTPAFNNITANLTVTAQYTENLPEVFTVTFKDHNGNNLKVEEVTAGGSATAPANPTRTGYTFTGWNPATFTNITADLTVTAQYTINNYTVSFNSNGGSAVTAITKPYNTAVGTLPTPTRTGYTFNGWFKEVALTNAYNATELVTANITVYAKWTQLTYTVTFNDHDGTVLKTQTGVPHGTAATAPASPTRTGYTFTGFTPAYSNVTANLTVTAQHTINNYTATFDSKDGSDVTAITKPYNEAVGTLPTPTREGFAFDGWYKEEDYTNAYTETELVTTDVTVYAKWI